MKKDTNRGFVTALFTVIAAVAVLAASYYVYENKISSVNEDNPLPSSQDTFSSSVVATSTISDVKATSTVSEVVFESKSNGQASLIDALKEEKNVPIKAVVVPAKEPQQEISPVETKSDPVLRVSLGDDVSQVLLVHDAKRVPFAKILLKAEGKDITVNSLTIERKGLGSDRIFSEIGVMGIDSERAPDANHQYKTRESFVVNDGEEMELVLFGNIASDLTEYDGQAPALGLVKIDADTPVEGELPMVGKAFSVNSNINIGSLTLTLGSFDPAINKTLYVNDKGVVFTGLKVTTDSYEPVYLNYVSWNQAGSAGRNDIENVKTYIVYKGENYVYDTEISEDGKYYSSDLGDGIKIGKGETADIYVKGDIGTTGSGRTVDFDIYGYWDVTGIGATYKQEIDSTGGDVDGQAPEGEFSNDVYPFFNAYAHTISSGTAQSIER